MIVGGGLNGCALAYTLATAGLRPLLIEAGRIGEGSAGRHAGLLLPEPGPAFRDVQQALGLRATRMAFESWRRAALDGAALLKRANIKCGIEPVDTLLTARSGDERVLRRDYEARAAAGLDAAWLTERQMRASTGLSAAGGIKARAGFALDPYRTCLGLAAAAVKRGARIHERSAAGKIRAGAKHVEIALDGASVRAGTVVVATGTATAVFKPLQRHFKRRESYLALTEPVPAAIRKQLFPPALALMETANTGHRLRWAPDNRLLIGGADQEETPAKRRDAVLVQRTGQLMYETLTMYPVISGLQPEYGWEAPYGTTADGLPYIGPHRNYPRHLFALGGDGDSVTGAFLAARILTRAIQGAPQKGDEVFGWTR